MASTTFVSGTTVASDWLNDVNDFVYNNTVNVTAAPYNAVGNGSTDDTAAIQACINANPGKTIYFPPKSYKITSTLTINSNATRLYSNGRVVIYAPVGNFDVFHFVCPTDGQYEYLNHNAIEGRFYIYTDASSTATTGAALRITRCNGMTIRGLLSLNMAEGFVIEGSKDCTFTDLRASMDPSTRDLSAISNSCLLKIIDSPTSGGTYQPSWTHRFINYQSSANYRTQYTVLVSSVDGLQFTNGYITGGKEGIFTFKNQRAGSSIASVTISDVYLDAVNQTTGAKRCVYIPNEGLGANVYNISFSNCFLGNCVEDTVLVTKRVTGLQFTGCTFANITKTGIDYTGDVAYTGGLLVTGCKLQTTNTGGSGYGIRVGHALELEITGNSFTHVGTNAAVKLDGSIADASISGNVIRAPTLDFENIGTVVRFTYGNNTTGLATTRALTGLKVGNVANSDPLSLDWYEEGTFTPYITYGNASVGITYTEQTGSFTRIGKRVFYELVIILSSKGSSSGNMVIKGLPYTATNSYKGAPGSLRTTELNSVTVGNEPLFAFVESNTSQIRVDKMATGLGYVIQLTEGDCTNTTEFRISGHYSV